VAHDPIQRVVIAKRLFDIVASGLLLALSFPLIALFALLVKLDSRGPAFFRQTRIGLYGQPFTGRGMSGYDNVTGKYWSTWNDSMSTGIMLSEGDCDADGACAFTGSWNDPVSKEKINARMTTRWTSPAVEVFEMYAPGPDGKESKMMEITYTRK